MSSEPLRIAAFCAYLGAWVVFAIGAIVGGMPAFQRRAGVALNFETSVVIGTILQIASVLAITLRLGDGPLRPNPLECLGALALAPLGATLFICALVSARHNASQQTLITGGVYAWMRHPIYLAFFAMLLATGLLASSGPKFAVAAIIYLAGSELRIAAEEQKLSAAFPAAYEQYRHRTRWRYFPGLR